MKLFGWDIGWSRNIAIGCIWTSPKYSSNHSFGSIAFLFLGLTISKSFPTLKD